MSVIGCHLHHMLLIWRSFRNSNKTFVPNLFYAGSFVNRSSFRMTTKWFCMTWQYRTNGDKSLNRRYNDGSIFIQLRARFTNVDQISVQLNQVQRWVYVNTTSAPSHRRPVFVDCHSRRLGIDRECTHSLTEMIWPSHFELCHDCGLGCLSESYGGCRWRRWCSCIK